MTSRKEEERRENLSVELLKIAANVRERQFALFLLATHEEMERLENQGIDPLNYSVDRADAQAQYDDIDFARQGSIEELVIAPVGTTDGNDSYRASLKAWLENPVGQPPTY